MNIGLFSETYYPEINGVAASVLILKEQLERLGHNVYVFTTTHPAAVRVNNVYRVPSVPFHMRRLGMFINPRLKHLIKRFDLDIVHTHTEFSLGIFGRSVARSLQVPFVHTMHTIYEEYTEYLIRVSKFEPAVKAAARKMTAAFCNTAAAVVAPTEKTKTLLHEYGVKKNVYVVPTGIRLEKFTEGRANREVSLKLRGELGISTEDKLLIYVGRVSKEKNLEEIIRYLGTYLPVRPDVKFLLVGDGPARSGLVQQVDELGIAGQVVFAGERPWDVIGTYYGLGDVFISASQSETQGLTYIEALASGLPLVVKYDQCLDGVINEGENGFTFTDEKGFAEALDKILNGRDTLSQMSKNAEITAGAFSDVHYGETLASIYEEAVATHKKYIQAS